MFKTVAMLAFIGVAAWAQGPQGRGPRNSPAVDMSRVQTIEGAITAVNIAAGVQYPSIEIAGNVIRVAPLWYLLDAGFELKAGDTVRVAAAPAATATGTYLHALEILNLATNEKLVLRTASGMPGWSGPGGGRAAMRSRGCLDPATATTITGLIDQVNAGVGIQMPSLTLNTGGTLLTIRIGPERVLLEADFELRAGDTVTVKYATCPLTGDRVALSITNAAGVTLVLRGDDGRPVW